MKPMLASDAVEDKIRFPCIIQPKIDGVRGLNMVGTLTGRSLKTHANTYTTNFYSSHLLAGLDGELIVGNDPCLPDLCRLTSSALSTITGEPKTEWWLFDHITEHTVNLIYRERLAFLRLELLGLYRDYPALENHLKLIPWHLCETLEELLAKENEWLEMGYEGIIVRDPNGKHKQGRSTVREMGLLRIKRFIEEEALVLSITEGETNLNEAQTNELGKTFRSSHKENKVPNGMVGNLQCRVLKDVFDQQTKKLLFKKDDIITVSPGTMTHADRLHYFQNPHLIVGKVIKYKFFPKGIKDKPRFPNYQAIRGSADL